MKRKGYLGISGVDCGLSVDLILKTVPSNLNGELLIASGVLASSVTLQGDLSTSHPRRNPAREAWDSFPQRQHADLISLLHFHCVNRADFRHEIAQIMLWMGSEYHGMQLNNAWLPVSDVAFCWEHLLRSRNREIENEAVRLVLQINSEALDACGNDPTMVAKQVRTYFREACITDVLIDTSAGGGQPFVPQFVETFLRAIQETCPDIGLGVAGGLGPETLFLLETLLPRYRYLSRDAESGLRDQLDGFNVSAAIEYLTKQLRPLQF